MNLTGNREPETDMRSVTAPDRRLFRTQGFLQGPVFLTQDQVAAACRGMDRVIAGVYRTGREPQSRGVAPGAATTRLIKINNSHLSDEDLFAVVANGEIARWAAQLLGAKRLHVWHTQLLFKPVGGDPGAGIGFHQDWKYWQFFDQLEGVITAWVALSDITVAGGAMRFVPGSNRWGLIDPGNFSEKDEATAIAALPLPAGGGMARARRGDAGGCGQPPPSADPARQRRQPRRRAAPRDRRALRFGTGAGGDGESPRVRRYPRPPVGEPPGLRRRRMSSGHAAAGARVPSGRGAA